MTLKEKFEAAKTALAEVKSAVHGQLPGLLRFRSVVERCVELQTVIVLFQICHGSDVVLQVVRSMVKQKRKDTSLLFDLCDMFGKCALCYDVAVAVRFPCPC